MLKGLQRAWEDIRRGENIDLYLTILVAFTLGVLNLFGLPEAPLVSSITLLVLGLLVASMLGIRHRLESISHDLKGSNQPFLKSRKEIPSLEERGQDASEIVMVGISLLVLYTNRAFFESKLQQGCRLRFLLLDPTSQALETYVLLSGQKGTLRDIANTFDALERLKEKELSSPGTVDARLTSVFLPYGIAAFNPGKVNGYMSVEPLVYRGGLEQRPHFVLRKANSDHWFTFFEGQYEQLWLDSAEWQPGMELNI